VRSVLFAAVLPLCGIAQGPVEGRVVDAATAQPLPFCNVGVAGATVGTLTNAEGRFRIDAAGPVAVLRFSYMGYATLELTAGEVARIDAVRMRPVSTVLAGFEVFPDDALYERVVHAARALDARPPAHARAYFELDTRAGGRPLEVIECFYNAGLRGARIERLDLKQGRIGIAPLGSRYFVSLNTTRAMVLLDPTGRSDRFPRSPFGIGSARRLRQRFSARMVEHGSDAEAVDHVRLEPRDGPHGFTADLWLSPADDRVLALELACTHCDPHPLIPFGHMRSIDSVDMRFRMTWDRARADAMPDHIELAYDLAYTNDSGGTGAVSTTALLHLFDPGGAFILPLFEHDGDQGDYRKITFQPYDTAFWVRAPSILRTGQQERDRAFFLQYGFLTGNSAPAGWKARAFFEHNHAWWSPERRISLKSLPPPKEDPAYPVMRPRGATAPIAQVRLVAQIYLDMDTTGGTFRAFSATVFDGFRSFHHLPEQTYTDAFINIFFDLCEIERRRLVEHLEAPGMDVVRARALHAEAEAAMERTADRYIKDVRLGADRIALQRWNDRVKAELGIDNMALFGLGTAP